MKKRSREHAKETVGKLQCVTFVVNDLQGVRTFYVEQLGLPIEREELDYVMLNAGPFSLCLDKGERVKYLETQHI